jgi:hypothetical protein
MPRLALLLLPVLLTPSPSFAQASKPAADPEVTIYRCTNANGALALRDSPCLKGEKQDVRTMQRPRDPAPVASPVAAPPAPVAPVSNTSVQVVYVTPPRPMYECVTPDGETYTSDNGEGNLRWVPYWSTGNPVLPRNDYTSSASVSGNVSIGNGTLSFQSGDPRPPRPPRPGHGGAGYAPGGVWIRDTCHALPQAEVCARLSDRRYEILRRYGSAMASERRTLDLEQRDIDARIANDCRNP